MTAILFVVSEHGYWAEECVDPLTTLSDAGVEITVATPTGEPPVVDDMSLDPDEVGEETAERVSTVIDSDERLDDPIALADAVADDYDAVFFPGGHGVAWDVTQDHHARELFSEAVAGEDGKALVVCHAVGLLAFTRDADGEFLAADRTVTGFPNAWEEGIVDDQELLPDGRKLPYWVEDEVRAVGANWDAELDADTSVQVDGDLITGRGPESSHAAARTLLDELGVA
ncbi:ThiJ/PfpI domain-containing protein [Halovivax asiaticus JCM 14624]|uniref:ThiJ/PfpI domain-containing protein n=1 Tax=Halovivax asiaticus JCM 14624 TaxID=1227490 RepID=M0BNZ4_9EURY|nr:DJ-1/PfpI family protein [Halovivax asiaticus]ELZ12008.1 ThiJ/PfpI domain-containing protein [Halovivax asiaticus JCM 14624]